MPFGMVNGVGHGMGVVDGSTYSKQKGQFWGLASPFTPLV